MRGLLGSYRWRRRIIWAVPFVAVAVAFTVLIVSLPRGSGIPEDEPSAAPPGPPAPQPVTTFGRRVRVTPATRREVMARMRPIETTRCPFANLPEPANARRGLALTAEVMKRCRWVKPRLVVQVAFTEWTDKDHLRHARYLGMRDDKPAREIRRESVAP